MAESKGFDIERYIMVQSQIPSSPSTLTVSQDILPEIVDWRVGEKYKVMMEIEQTGMESSGYGEEPTNPIMGRFKIVSAKVMGMTGKSGKQKITANPPEKQDNLEYTGTSPEERITNSGEIKKKVIERIGERSKTG